jgi:hypothetical protein
MSRILRSLFSAIAKAFAPRWKRDDFTALLLHDLGLRR